MSRVSTSIGTITLSGAGDYGDGDITSLTELDATAEIEVETTP